MSDCDHGKCIRDNCVKCCYCRENLKELRPSPQYDVNKSLDDIIKRLENIEKLIKDYDNII